MENVVEVRGLINRFGKSVVQDGLDIDLMSAIGGLLGRAVEFVRYTGRDDDATRHRAAECALQELASIHVPSYTTFISFTAALTVTRA